MQKNLSLFFLMPLLTLQVLGIFYNLKGDEIKLANNDEKQKVIAKSLLENYWTSIYSIFLYVLFLVVCCMKLDLFIKNIKNSDIFLFLLKAILVRSERIGLFQLNQLFSQSTYIFCVSFLLWAYISCINLFTIETYLLFLVYFFLFSFRFTQKHKIHNRS